MLTCSGTAFLAAHGVYSVPGACATGGHCPCGPSEAARQHVARLQPSGPITASLLFPAVGPTFLPGGGAPLPEPPAPAMCFRGSVNTGNHVGPGKQGATPVEHTCMGSPQCVSAFSPTSPAQAGGSSRPLRPNVPPALSWQDRNQTRVLMLGNTYKNDHPLCFFTSVPKDVFLLIFRREEGRQTDTHQSVLLLIDAFMD